MLMLFTAIGLWGELPSNFRAVQRSASGARSHSKPNPAPASATYAATGHEPWDAVPNFLYCLEPIGVIGRQVNYHNVDI
jgi:hypothetical protein